VKTIVVSGLLGSGKTTFIRDFIAHHRERAAVLVNDFGETGIDGEIFSADGIDYIELPSGCVCCSLKSDLITAIGKIVSEIGPESLLIEPSGVASPSSVLGALEIMNVAPVTVVGIVDATEFLELYEADVYGSFFEDQIVNSDLLLVNKTDIVDEETIGRTIVLLESLNPGALILRTVNAELPVELPESVTDSGRPPRKSGRAVGPHLNFETISLRIPDGISRSVLERLFEDLAGGMYGAVARAKALVNADQGAFRFDLSFSTVDMTGFDKTVPEGRLVVIGNHIERDKLMDFCHGAGLLGG